MYYMIVNLHWEGDIMDGSLFFTGLIQVRSIVFFMGEARGFFSMFFSIRGGGVTTYMMGQCVGYIGGGSYI